jgi:uncharacterized protein (TIGR00251 family)
MMEVLREVGSYLLIDIEVSPNSNNFEIAGYNTWRKTLIVKIRSPPTKGKANREIIREFSKIIGADVEIISGLKSQKKTLKITGKNKDEILMVLDRIAKK